LYFLFWFFLRLSYWLDHLFHLIKRDVHEYYNFPLCVSIFLTALMTKDVSPRGLNQLLDTGDQLLPTSMIPQNLRATDSPDHHIPLNTEGAENTGAKGEKAKRENG